MQKSSIISWTKLPQILAVLSATLSTVSDGMHYAWTSPAIPILLSNQTPVKITQEDSFWLEYVYFIGGIVSLPFTIAVSKKLGSKKCILIAATENLIAWSCIGLATSADVLFIGRFFSGFAGVVSFVSVPMYIAEIADQNIRGFLAAFVYLMLLVGILISNSVTPFVSIATSSAIGGCFAIALLLTFPFMPDSPYYLLLHDQDASAKEALQRLRSTQEVGAEFIEISLAVDRQKQERGRLIDILIVASNRKALIIIVGLNAAQHFSGITVILMNLHSILSEANSAVSPTVVAVLFSISMLLAAFGSACLVDRFGRRFLLMSSSVSTGLVLLVISWYFKFCNSSNNTTNFMNWIPVFATIAYGIVFKLGLGMVPIVTTGELFPSSVKSIGMALADGLYITFSLLSVLMYQYLSQQFGIYLPLFIFALCAVSTAVFTFFYIPETTGKTLEEIQMILKGQMYELIDSSKYGSIHVFE